MQIRIKPSDLIERGLYLNYKKFLLKNNTESQIKQIVENDEPFIITENDAWVIGLLKCVRTTNLIHRFTMYINELVDIKSQIDKDKQLVIISKSSVLNDVENFRDSFPSYYNYDADMKNGLEDLNNYLPELIEKINKLETIIIETKTKKKITCLKSKDVLKLVKNLNK